MTVKTFKYPLEIKVCSGRAILSKFYPNIRKKTTTLSIVIFNRTMPDSIDILETVGKLTKI